MRVALVCPTLGQTRRGYERFMSDVHRTLADDVEFTVFKGAGPRGPREKVVPHVRRTGWLSRLCGNRLRYPRFHLEFASFTAALLPHLARGGFDLVHFIDPPLGRLLHFARHVVHGRFGLLYTNAGPHSHDASRWVDHTHCLNPITLEETIASGVPADRVTMLPIPVNLARLDVAEDRAALRRRHGVDEDAFVVLSVTTLNRHHKRVDHLIEEAAGLEGNVLLWVEGGLHPDGDPTLLDLGRARLGPRFRHTHVASEQVGELFRLADVLVSTAVQESFGMAVVEAMCAGLPVLTHDSLHFRWLVGGDDAERAARHVLDMEETGALTARLAALMDDRAALDALVDPDAVIERFRWETLKHDYLDVYERTARRQPSRLRGGSNPPRSAQSGAGPDGPAERSG
jgi:glycosyltransferase involved in cell wall biosynthesis